MERITPHQVVGLMEAYNAVHVSKEQVELTEEQVQEDFENWVNSLVEEGHDLSEYTWEEMYEAYLSEIPINPAGNTRPISNAPYQSRFARPMNAGTPQRTGRATAVSRPQIGGMGGLGAGYRGAELQQAAKARASQVGTSRQGTAGGPTTGGNTPVRQTATTRPAAPAAPSRPVPTAARPAAPAPAPTAAKPATTPATAAPSAATMGFKLAQQGVNLAEPKKPSLASQTAEIRAMQAASRQRQGLTQSFDIFDVVLGHLIDEGYADTEQAALQIMANMSEEWKQSILEAPMNPAEIERIAQQASDETTGKKKKRSKKVPAGMRE